MIDFRQLSSGEICRELFTDFIRRQEVTMCRRREGSEWVIKADPFIDDWSDTDYHFLVKCLKHTADSGGFVYAAFCNGSLKGFVSVEAELFGGEHKYLDLSSIHVSADMRGQGVGRKLFSAAKSWAKSHNAKKLYISSHSAIETQMFYKSMGCTDAKAYSPKHTESEHDCQLECLL